MERKVPPPQGFGAPPVINVTQPQPFARQSGRLSTFKASTASATNEQDAPPPPPPPPIVGRNGRPYAFEAHYVHSIDEKNAPPPLPLQPNAPQSSKFPMAHGLVNTTAGATSRGWKPGRGRGRHDSPLYGMHRKRPASPSIDSNMSWSGSEIESVGEFYSEQEQVSRLSCASSIVTSEAASFTSHADLSSAASLFETPPTNQHAFTFAAKTEEQKTTRAGASEARMDAHPPKMSLTLENDEDVSATQPVRGELPPHEGSLAGSRTIRSENMFISTKPPAYDEGKNGPQSCPSTFNQTRQPQFSIDNLRQLRSHELVASKLLPTRTSVDSLMGYVRELQSSEAMLRKQLVKTKQHTEEELSHSLLKVNELERTMMEVERDRMLSRQKLNEQEKLICDLAAKLKKAEKARGNDSAPSSVDELPSIAEEAVLEGNTEDKTSAAEMNELKPKALPLSTPATVVQSAFCVPPVQQEQVSMHPGHPHQLQGHNRVSQFDVASPRSPNQPLWDPWASGGATPMKNHPPVFTIGSTALDQVAASSTLTAQTFATLKTVIAPGEYELKSVLMSPRRVQDQVETAEVDRLAQQSHFGASSSSYEQDSSFPMTHAEQAYGARGQKENPSMESTLHDVSMHSDKSIATSDEYIDEQQEASNVFTISDISDATGANHFEIQAHQEDPHIESNESRVKNDLAPSSSPRLQVVSENDVPKGPAFGGKRAQGTRSMQTSISEATSVSASMSSALPVGSPVSPVLSTPPFQNDGKETVLAEPVSLEALLVDFYNEVDEKRINMATIYGKRYAGRENWLFAELTKRYGAAKVATLKTRFERVTGASTFSDNGHNNKKGKRTAMLSNAPDQLKTSRQDHPQHPQFVPPSGVNASAADVRSVSYSSQDGNALDVQPRLETDETGISTSSSGVVFMDHGANASLDDDPLSAGFPPSPQETSKRDRITGAAMNELLMVNSSTPAQFDKSTTPNLYRSAMEANNAPPVGLRQRYNTSKVITQDQKNEPPTLSLEALLKDLYKNHQPDKLKNASIVAKQYAGKERELVCLLKGKYGALSVKRLEESLEGLERAQRAHRARILSQSAHKKRGCFIRTISLAFWLSVLLYFSFGAVFVSFVIIDALECRGFGNDEHELVFAENCDFFKKELKTFTYERIADYASQSCPDACFCSEWNARQSVLFTNFSGQNLLDLAKLVPFSPDSFGTPWIARVKEQIPSQEFYDSYAKHVVDLSLSGGSFLWFSVLEFSGYNNISEKNPQLVKSIENGGININLLDHDTYRLKRDDKPVKEENKAKAVNKLPNEVAASEDVYYEIDADVRDQLPYEDEVAARKYAENESEVEAGHQLPDKYEESPNENFDKDGEFEARYRLSHEVEADNVENERDFEAGFPLPGEDEVSGTKNKKSGVEADDNKVPDVSVALNEGSLEEDIGLNAESPIDETGIDMKDRKSVEAAVPVGEELDKVSLTATSESDENQDAVLSVDLSELDKIFPAEEPELIATNEEGLATGVGEATEILTEDDAHTLGESIDGKVEGLHSFSDDGHAFVTFEAVKELSGSTSKEFKVVSADKSIQSNKVVEIEVRQEDIGLSYPETEIYVSGENLTAEIPYDSFSVVAEELSELSVDINGDKTDPEVISKLSNASVEMDMQDFESFFYASEEISSGSRSDGVDADAEVTDAGSASDVLSKTSHFETADVENVSTSNEKNEVEAEDIKLAAVVDDKERKKSADLEDKLIAYEDGHADKVVEEKIILEPFLASNDVKMTNTLVEDSIRVTLVDNYVNQSVEVTNDADKIYAASSVAGIEFVSGPGANDANAHEMEVSMDEIKIESIPAEVVASNFIGLMDDSAEANAEGLVEEMDDIEKASADEATLIHAEVVPDALPDTHQLEPRWDIERESFDVDEKDEKDSNKAESNILNVLEASQIVPESDVANNLAVAIDATKKLVGIESDNAETGGYMPEYDKNVEYAGVKEMEAETFAAEDTKIATNFDRNAFSGSDDAISIFADEESFENGDAMQDADSVLDVEAILLGEVMKPADETDTNILKKLGAEEFSPSAMEGGERGGLVSAVNEVLARLVEPFEAAKSTLSDAAPNEGEIL